MNILDHAGQALGQPDLIRLQDNVFVIRFETMKIASARCAVQQLLAEGVIHEGDTVIDSSSGLYAFALAVACHELGLHCKIIGSMTIDPIEKVQLELLGADLEQVPPSSSLRQDQNLRVARIQEIIRRNPHVHWMQQYHDHIHDYGYIAMSHDIASALTEIGVTRVELVAPVGSGVSSFSIGNELSKVLPVDITAVQPFGSITFGSDHVPDPEMIIAGIGSSIPFRNVRHEIYSKIHWVSYEVACSATLDLMQEYGLFSGLSTGAAWAAAKYEHLNQYSSGSATVFISPDTGHRYFDDVYKNYRDFPSLDSYSPREVSSLDELTIPWCRMRWNHWSDLSVPRMRNLVGSR